MTTDAAPSAAPETTATNGTSAPAAPAPEVMQRRPRAERLAALRSRESAGAEAEGESKGPNGPPERGASQPVVTGRPAAETSPSSPASAPAGKSLAERIEELGRAEEEKIREKTATRQQQAEIQKQAEELKERAAKVAHLEGVGEKLKDPKWLLRQLAVVTREKQIDETGLNAMWAETMDPRAYADMRAEEAQSATARELAALKAEREAEKAAKLAAEEAAQQEAAMQAAAEEAKRGITGLAQANPDRVPRALAFLQRDPATFWDTADQIARTIPQHVAGVQFHTAVLQMIETALTRYGEIAQAPQSNGAQQPSPTPSPANPPARPVRQGTTLTNQASAEAASLGGGKLPRAERIKRLRAQELASRDKD